MPITYVPVYGDTVTVYHAPIIGYVNRRVVRQGAVRGQRFIHVGDVRQGFGFRLLVAVAHGGLYGLSVGVGYQQGTFGFGTCRQLRGVVSLAGRQQRTEPDQQGQRGCQGLDIDSFHSQDGAFTW